MDRKTALMFLGGLTCVSLNRLFEYYSSYYQMEKGILSINKIQQDVIKALSLKQPNLNKRINLYHDWLSSLLLQIQSERSQVTELVAFQTKLNIFTKNDYKQRFRQTIDNMKYITIKRIRLDTAFFQIKTQIDRRAVSFFKTVQVPRLDPFSSCKNLLEMKGMFILLSREQQQKIQNCAGRVANLHRKIKLLDILQNQIKPILKANQEYYEQK